MASSRPARRGFHFVPREVIDFLSIVPCKRRSLSGGKTDTSFVLASRSSMSSKALWVILMVAEPICSSRGVGDAAPFSRLRRRPTLSATGSCNRSFFNPLFVSLCAVARLYGPTAAW